MLANTVYVIEKKALCRSLCLLVSNSSQSLTWHFIGFHWPSYIPQIPCISSSPLIKRHKCQIKAWTGLSSVLASAVGSLAPGGKPPEDGAGEHGGIWLECSSERHVHRASPQQPPPRRGARPARPYVRQNSREERSAQGPEGNLWTRHRWWEHG